MVGGKSLPLLGESRSVALVVKWSVIVSRSEGCPERDISSLHVLWILVCPARKILLGVVAVVGVVPAGKYLLGNI